MFVKGIAAFSGLISGVLKKDGEQGSLLDCGH
jgi:hypothetical protein